MLTKKLQIKPGPGQYIPASGGGDRDGVISEMIASYYNGTDLDDSGLEGVKFFNQRGNHFRGIEGLVGLLHIEFGAFDLPDRLLESYPRAVEELTTHRPAFVAAVKWLCSRKEPDEVKSVPLEDAGILATPQGKAAPEEAKNALRQAIRNIRKMLLASQTPLSAEDEANLRFFQEHGRDHVHKSLRSWGGRLVEVSSQPIHFVDFFCSFLLEKCIDKEPEELPVKLCPTCGKLFASKPNKVYCSTGPRGCGYQKFWTREKRADDMYVRRLENYAPRDIRKKLDDPAVEHRLAVIERRWPKDSAIVASIARIRKRCVIGDGSQAKRKR